MYQKETRWFFTHATKCLLILVLCTVGQAHPKSSQNSYSTANHQTNNQQLEQHILDNLALRIGARISNMKVIAKSLANDTHIHNWVKQGMPASAEPLLLNKLNFYVSTFELTSASFADKKSNKYWNHEGFLRVLSPEIDTWYFNYISTDNPELVSIYHDMNKKRVDLYVNYQQVNDIGLSGVASSFNSFMDKLQISPLAKQGTLFIADKVGNIKVHPKILDGYKNLKVEDVLGRDKAKSMLEALSHKSADIQHDEFIMSPIGDIGWYLVYFYAQPAA